MKLTVDTKLTPRQVAESFAEMNDEEQAQVFIELGEIAKAWRGSGSQWWMVGRHLRDCSCSTGEARDIVADIHDGMTRENIA